MRSVNITMSKKISLLSIICCGCISLAHTQNINSPYSRYGIGDLLPSQNILSRAMGGVGAAYYDYSSVNFLNPASYARLQATTFDFGLEVDNLTLRAVDPPRKYSNASPQISYIQLGVPLKKKGGWGLVFGLRPISRINYNIQTNERLSSGTLNDSVQTVFEGTGGSQEVFVGTAFAIKHFSLGVNAGYLFGSKNYSTRRSFINDTILYYKSNHQTKSNYGGLYFNVGAQYSIPLNKKSQLQLGVYGSWQQDLHATRSLIRETYDYSDNTGNYTIDSVYTQPSQSGTISMPASYGAGIMFNKSGRFLLGLDYSAGKWSQYRYFDSSDFVQDSWEMHLGGQVIPSGGKTYWSNVAYRGGFSIGREYLKVDNNLPKWTVSFGVGLPMRRQNYSNQFSIINTTFEFGQLGNKQNAIRENFFRLSVGFSLSDIWFVKRKYD